MRSDKVSVWSLNVAWTGNYLWYNFIGGGGTWYSNTISTTSVSDWHHIVLTVTPGTPPLFYFDGQLRSTSVVSFAGPLNSLPSDYSILGDQRLFGQLDDIQVYLDLLPAKRVRFLYQYPGKRLSAGDVDKDGIGDMCGRFIIVVMYTFKDINVRQITVLVATILIRELSPVNVVSKLPTSSTKINMAWTNQVLTTNWPYTALRSQTVP